MERCVTQRGGGCDRNAHAFHADVGRGHPRSEPTNPFTASGTAVSGGATRRRNHR